MSEVIACNGCGRSFVVDDAYAMLAAIEGPCPVCGGTFAASPTPGARGWHLDPGYQGQGAIDRG
jgi:hypothetical protein